MNTKPNKDTSLKKHFHFHSSIETVAIKILGRNSGGLEVGFQEITEQQLPDRLTATAYSNRKTNGILWPI